MTTKRTRTNLKVILSFIIGFAISVLTRLSIFVFATDFSYIKIGHRVFLPKMHLSFAYNFTESNTLRKCIGKKILGAGGFPFSTFSHCSLERSGSSVLAVCDKLSTIGEFSILLNAILWGAVVFCLALLFSQRKKK